MNLIQSVSPVRFQGHWRVDGDVIKECSSLQAGKKDYERIGALFSQDSNRLAIEALPHSVELEYNRSSYHGDSIEISMDMGVAHGQYYREELKPKIWIPFFRKPEKLGQFIQRAVKRAQELSKELNAL